LLKYIGPKGNDSNICETISRNLFVGIFKLLWGVLALHQDEFAARFYERNNQGDERAKGADGTRRDLIPRFPEGGLLRPRPAHGHVYQAQLPYLLVKPRRSSFHGLNQGELNIWSGDGHNDSRQAPARTHINDVTRPEDFRKHAAVEDVAGPQSARFARANQPTFLSLLCEVPRKGANLLHARRKDGCRDRRFWLQLNCHVSRETRAE
jgi:hypothetical protein